VRAGCGPSAGSRLVAARDCAPTQWYGFQAEWWVPLERDARRRYGAALQRRLAATSITYRLDGLHVPGRAGEVPVEVRFYAVPPYDCYGLDAEDYPRVWADRDLPSPHRMPDRSLCLYYPLDPPERRWVARRDGLAVLFDLIADHLFCELHWRATGAVRHGEWVGDEAAHGFPRGTAT